MTPVTKIVNIKAEVTIKDFKPPIHGTCNNVRLTTGQILRCLCKRAIVDEVLPDGTLLRLDMSNYYLDNAGKVKVPVAEHADAKVQVVETRPDDVEENANTAAEELSTESNEVKLDEEEVKEPEAVEGEKLEAAEEEVETELENSEEQEENSSNTVTPSYNKKKHKKH